MAKDFADISRLEQAQEATSAKRDAVSKMVKAWESKNAKRAMQGAGLTTMAVTLAACGGSDEAEAPAPTTPVEAVSGTPSVGFDQITGTSGANAMNFFVVQNAMGEQTNQFGTGDQIDLGGGNDTLNVVVQDASSLNAGPAGSIAAYLTSVETVNFTALNDSDTENNGAEGADTVEINGAFWLGTDVISSVASDASLTVYNVNTLGADQSYGDIGALTATMTIRMDHTGNDNSIGAESDMTVLFDEDYLLAGTVTATDGAARFYLLDQDGALQGGDATALSHLVDANLQVDAAGTERVFIERDGVSFDLDGARVTLTVDPGANGDYAGIDTHAQYAAALQDSADAQGIAVTVTVDNSDLRTTFLDDGSAYSVPAIVVTSATAEISNPDFETRDAGQGYEFNIFGRFTSESSTTTAGNVEVNVELNKVGRAGDGGDLIIGGMENDGIEVFHVEVQGRADQPSSLASLASTNNVLETVNVASAAGSLAALEIGNGNTAHAAGDSLATTLGALATVNTLDVVTAANNGLVDVQIFNAAAFDNGVSVSGHLSSAVVDKYMDLTDNAANPAADNVGFEYTTGDGADSVNLLVAEENLAQAGQPNREDFDLSIDTGAGDDSIEFQIGDGQVLLVTENHYVNMDLNSNMGISAGAGNDYVHTYGSTIMSIDAGAGDDAVYTDNSGAQVIGVVNGTDITQASFDFNNGKAVWVGNAADNTIVDLESGANDSTSLWRQTVEVTYRGIVVSQTITDYATTDLEMNNIIKGLVNNDVHLSKLLLVEDGPANTITVKSLIDGTFAAGDLTVAINENALGVLSENSIAAWVAANGLTAAQVDAIDGADNVLDAAEVQTYILGANVEDVATNEGAVGGQTGAWTTRGDYAMDLADDNDSTGAVADLTGANSTTTANQNVVVDGAGEDTIVLSTDIADVETVNLTADTNSDVIANASNAVVTGMNGDIIILNSDGGQASALTVSGTSGTIVFDAGNDTVTISSVGSWTLIGHDASGTDNIDVAGLIDTVATTVAIGASANFADGGGNVTASATAHTLIFNSVTGQLIYDASGDTTFTDATNAVTDTAGDDIVIATFDDLTLLVADFTIA